MEILKPNEAQVRYSIFGTPDRAFVEGLHGNESIAHVLIWDPLNDHFRYSNTLGASSGIIHIGTASESAVARGTRKNMFGNNLNRMFYQRTSDPEARKIMEFFEKTRKKYGSLKRILITHIDVYKTQFYMYDWGNSDDGLDHNKMLREIEGSGITLLNGRDVPKTNTDPAVGYVFKDGYAYFSPYTKKGKQDKSLECYCIRNGLAERVIVAEIPGKISLEKKEIVGKMLVNYMLNN